LWKAQTSVKVVKDSAKELKKKPPFEEEGEQSEATKAMEELLTFAMPDLA
jgi:hypothetical protein